MRLYFRRQSDSVPESKSAHSNKYARIVTSPYFQQCIVAILYQGPLASQPHASALESHSQLLALLKKKSLGSDKIFPLTTHTTHDFCVIIFGSM